MRKAIILVLALALLGCAIVALAQYKAPPEGMPGPGPGRMMGGMGGMGMGMASCPAMTIAPPPPMIVGRLDTLGLTADQKDKLTAALTKSDTTLLSLRQAAAQASMALRGAIFAPTYDAAKTTELLATAQKAETALGAAEVQTWTQIRAILTTDQIQKLDQAMQDRGRMGGPGGRRNRGQQPGGPGPGGPGPGALPESAPPPPGQ